MDFSRITAALTERGYRVSVFRTKEEAADYLDSTIDKTTVGFGGSVTLSEMKIADRLEKHNEIVSHWRTPGAETVRHAMTTAVYLSSVNAISENGEIVNIDGTCNRVSSIMYGHERVILVVGNNKITPDYDSAVFRARNVAAPKNAQRLGRKTPCAATADRCYDCKSPERICKALAVLWQSPGKQITEIVLVDEPLGY